MVNMQEVEQDTTDIISDSVVDVYCTLVGIPDSEINMVIALARCESGRYHSQICRENHNLFGMKYHKSMPTVALKDSNGYAYYDTYLMSCVDLALYFRKYGYGLEGYSSVKNYKDFLLNE